MATWVTHLMIADRVLQEIPGLHRHEFCVGNIAPDCNVENEDWTSFTPSREVTHWMSNERKSAADCERFLYEYMEQKEISSEQEASFLWGYYAHLITDAEFQRVIREEARVKAAWERVMAHEGLREKAVGMPATWDSVKLLINGRERNRDVYSLECEYLDSHPDSGYLTEILGLKTFPDYMDYLPAGAISRKVGIMGYLPQKSVGEYTWIAMSKEEYLSFIDRATELAVNAIRLHRKVK